MDAQLTLGGQHRIDETSVGRHDEQVRRVQLEQHLVHHLEERPVAGDRGDLGEVSVADSLPVNPTEVRVVEPLVDG